MQILSKKSLGPGAWVPQETWDRLLTGQLAPTAKDVAFQMPGKGVWMSEDDFKTVLFHVADWRAYRRRVEACFAVTWPDAP